MYAKWREDVTGVYMQIGGGISIEVKKTKRGYNPHICGISHPHDFPTLEAAKDEGLQRMREHLQNALAKIS